MFTSTIEPEQLTATIRSLLTAHLARDAEAALPLFAPDAVVD